MQIELDHLMERLTFNPKVEIDANAPHHPNKLAPIPWTPELEPKDYNVSDAPPHADAVIVTWTAAEWQAMCDVLAPMVMEHDYDHNYADFVPDFTMKSPARFSHCLARYRSVTANGKHIILMHSMLHIATDSPNVPLIKLFNQIIDETNCSKIITTGTAGGIGADKQLGDVIIGDACRFNCKKHLADKDYNHKAFHTSLTVVNSIDTFPFIKPNMDQLAGVNDLYMSFHGDIETTDFFAFDTSTDHFGLQKEDNMADAVEMDDAVLGLVIDQRKVAAKTAPLWGAVRNVSDPQADMSKYATFEDASRDMGNIYRRYGYWTTVPSVIESWCMAVLD